MKYFILVLVLVISLFAKDLQNEDGMKSKIDIEDINNKLSQINMQKWMNEEFGLKPYRANYILPLSVANQRYVYHGPDGLKYKREEAEIQVSLKLKFFHNLFGLHEKYYLSYTQQAFWQVYVYSSPFRDTIYNPEGFIVFPISDTKSIFHMRSFKFALAHKSNGQPNTTNVPAYNGFNLSKSINYSYITARLQHGTLLTDLTLMAPLPGSANLSDNPDIMKYLGYTKVKFTYFNNKSMYTLMVRGNIDSLKGAVEGTYSYPLRRDKVYFYTKFFSGYGESLLTYNSYVTKFSVGFSFSR